MCALTIRIACALACIPLVVGAGFALPGVVSVRDFGALGDGAHDDTAAFQAALDRAAATGGTVLVDPVPPGGGYVLTREVVLRRGTSLVGSLAGMPFIAWEGVPRSIQTGAVILARPAPDQYAGKQKRALFTLEGGNTLRGLYILYDRQPWPSDAEFADPKSPYHYPTLEEIIQRFIPEHVTPVGPTVMVRPGAASTTIEDLTCGRYWDFCYIPGGGKIVISRIYLYGYRRAFAIREGRDTIRISQVHLVPNVEEPISWQHAKLQAAITAHPGNIAFDMGSVDGYSISDATIFLVHTGVKLGASQEAPFLDPLTDERVTHQWGLGPWGSLHNVKVDNCVVGFDCALGTILPNQLGNVMVHLSIGTPELFPAAAGAVARQAAFLVRSDFAGATLQANNLALSSFAPRNVVATGKMVHEAGGRAFLVDCPPGKPPVDYADRSQANLEICGLVVSNIPKSHLYAATPGTRPAVRVRGFVHNGVPQQDQTL